MYSGIAAIAFGVAVLAWSADQFVIGAARVALLRRVPVIVVGLVIVGFGTSAPELLVSALATADGETAVAIGNVVGSNIANLTLLLGVGALIVPLTVQSRTVRLEVPIVVAATALFALVVQGGIARWEGALLVVAMIVALVIITRRPSGQAAGAVDPIGADVDEFADAGHHRLGHEVGRTAIGLVGTVASAQLLLWGALRVAAETGLSDGFVGVTLVAVGTSLPELVTVIQSARRSETDLIVGNLLGSNLFNALVVGGTIGLIGASPVDDARLTILGVSAAVAAALVAAVMLITHRRVSRTEGVILVICYAALVPFLA